MQQQMITLVPVPRQVAWGQEWLTLSESLTVAVTGEQQALLPTVGRFVRFARQRLGLPVSVTASSVARVSSDHRPGAHGVGIEHSRRHGVWVGHAAAGAGRSGPVPSHRVIEDWPDLPRRGLMLDISRGKVPQMERLYRLVDLLADLKLNELQLYTEHTFAYRNHREVWQDFSTIPSRSVRWSPPSSPFWPSCTMNSCPTFRVPTLM